MAQLLPPASTRSSVPALSRKAKAAIVVRLLLDEGTEIPLEDLPEALQAQLTQQMGAMRTVDRRTLAVVIDEFAEELAQIGLSFPNEMAVQPQLRTKIYCISRGCMIYQSAIREKSTHQIPTAARKRAISR
jgi:hypothetical protein